MTNAESVLASLEPAGQHWVYTHGVRTDRAVPSWRWHEIRAGHEELVLFEISDRPVHDAFGIYRADAA